jgi:predicted amidohydrolase
MSSRERFRVACVQTQPEFGAVGANLDAAERLLEPVEADLVVLPELFATGYSFRDRRELAEFAEPYPEGPTVERLCAWSERTGGMVIGGFVEGDGERFYNAAAVVANGRTLHVYRKLHLFGFEPEYFDAGDGELPVIEHAGLRVGVMICFDWIYPEAARCLALAGADVIAHPSNLVLPWCQRAMPTRALENGVYAVTCNRVGEETRPPRPSLRFTGHSVVVSPTGDVLAEALEDDVAVLETEIDVSRSRNKTLPSGNDPLAERRPAFYARLLRPAAP